MSPRALLMPFSGLEMSHPRTHHRPLLPSSANLSKVLGGVMIFTWLLTTFFLVTIFFFFFKGNNNGRLPPGPLAIPILGNLLWLWTSPETLAALIRRLHARYGPIVTLRIGSERAIFVSDRHLAHDALVTHGAVFADRPANRHMSSNNHNINSASYGPLWRLLRRNLTSELLHHSRLKLFSHARQWALNSLTAKLRASSEANNGVVVDLKESLRFALTSLLAFMCFGEKLDEKAIRDMDTASRDFLLYVNSCLIFLPISIRYISSRRWTTAINLHKKLADMIIPLIRTREKEKLKVKDRVVVYSYVDSLLDINLAEEGNRKLTDEDMVALCMEFMTGGTESTTSTLEWIMADIVKHQDIQRKVFDEMQQVVGSEAEEVKEEDLQRMPYLKAVVLEGLRRHPAGHFLLPHCVTEEVKLNGYVIPKGAWINFMVPEMGRDEKVWFKPMEFKPERFMEGGEGEGVDITGSREIKMMPFGAGRRVCPGLGLAMLHLEYFVANLVREFEWKAVEGREVDFSEKLEISMVMKNPLFVCVVPRSCV